ncbi:unnamed protein product [Prunus armeniaca]
MSSSEPKAPKYFGCVIKSVKIAFYSYDSEERDLVNIFASLSLKPSNLPARDVPWKGGFILDAATPGEFIGGLKTTM